MDDLKRSSDTADHIAVFIMPVIDLFIHNFTPLCYPVSTSKESYLLLDFNKVFSKRKPFKGIQIRSRLLKSYHSTK